jgi:hypothetical protein
MMDKNWTMSPKMFAEQAKVIYDQFAPKWEIFGLDVHMAMLIRQGVILLVMIGALLYSLPASEQESELAKRVAELSDRLAFSSKGQILSVKGDQVYLDMGEQAGIVEGTRFEVVRLGEPLLAGGKIMGHEETIIGEIEILRVREGSAIAKMVKKEQPFEKGDRVYQLKKRVQRVAVAEFPYGETFNDFTKNVQDMLYTSLTQKGMSVVERQKLEEVLREQKIAYTGIAQFLAVCRSVKTS